MPSMRWINGDCINAAVVLYLGCVVSNWKARCRATENPGLHSHSSSSSNRDRRQNREYHAARHTGIVQSLHDPLNNSSPLSQNGLFLYWALRSAIWKSPFLYVGRPKDHLYSCYHFSKSIFVSFRYKELSSHCHCDHSTFWFTSHIVTCQ
jgi:hypothetical protein